LSKVLTTQINTVGSTETQGAEEQNSHRQKLRKGQPRRGPGNCFSGAIGDGWKGWERWLAHGLEKKVAGKSGQG
jgi:hypothetical protein